MATSLLALALIFNQDSRVKKLEHRVAALEAARNDAAQPSA